MIIHNLVLYLIFEPFYAIVHAQMLQECTSIHIHLKMITFKHLITSISARLLMLASAFVNDVF